MSNLPQPTRVIINAGGEALPPFRAKEMGIVWDVIFIRNDGWSLGAPKNLEQIAYNMWMTEWVAVIHEGKVRQLWSKKEQMVMSKSKQVIIYRKCDKTYLKRKRSYRQSTWTNDLQEARVWTPGGAERAIKSMKGGTYVGGSDKKINVDCAVAPVLLKLGEE